MGRLPLTPIEAYSVGKTVIGTAVDGTPEIIRDGVDGLSGGTAQLDATGRKDERAN